MKQQWAECESDLDVQLLTPMPQFAVTENSSPPATGAKLLRVPNGKPEVSRGPHPSRRLAPPRRREGGGQSQAAPSLPFPGNDGSAGISLASPAALPVATEVPGLETLAAISSALAHEVRGPLRWVTSFSELLVEEEGASLNQTGKDYLQRISGAAARLDRVMRDLQRFVTEGIQQPRQEIVSLESVVCAVLGSLTSEISAKNAHVTVLRPLPPVTGDADWIQQCVTHLLDNALKFVSPGTAPCVSIRAESRLGFVRLCIEDNGSGIPATHHERIFGLFTQLSHDFPGTGAGLALTRQACERMGGRTGVESKPGRGSRFWIELPAAA
jgi:signal transduction histidine kinase